MDFSPTSTDFFTGENGGCKRMPWRVHKHVEPTHPNNGENISHIEVPTELLQQVEKQHNTSTKDGNNTRPQENKGNKYQGGQGGGDPKKPRSIHLWITKLREVWQKPLTDANYPLL